MFRSSSLNSKKQAQPLPTQEKTKCQFESYSKVKQKSTIILKVQKKNLVQEESKDQQAKTGYTTKPSTKYTNIKTIDPFSNNKKTEGSQNIFFIQSNSFSYVYKAGGIPCRVSHGTSKCYLQWNQDVILSEIPFDPILVTCFEGLIEEGHPYNFIANNCIKELLECDNSAQKCIPILPKLIWPLRNALQSTSDVVFEGALNTFKQLSDTLGVNLNSHIKNLLQPLAKKMDKKYREKIFLVLKSIAENGVNSFVQPKGDDVIKKIKSTIPTYSNV